MTKVVVTYPGETVVKEFTALVNQPTTAPPATHAHIGLVEISSPGGEGPPGPQGPPGPPGQQTMFISDTPPSSPSHGEIWWESDTGVTYIWYNDGDSGQWVQTSTGAGAPPVVVYDTVALLTAANVDASVKRVSTLGYYAVGDGGGTAYVRNPAATVFQTSNGGTVKWQVEQRHDFNVRWYGANPSQADNTAAFALAKTDAKTTALPFTIFIPAGNYEFTSGPAIADLNGWGMRYVGVGSPDFAVSNVAASTLIAKNNAYPIVRLDGSDSCSFEGIHFTYNDVGYTHDLVDISGTAGVLSSRITFDRCRMGGYNWSSGHVNSAKVIKIYDVLDVHIVRCAINGGVVGIAGVENRVVDTANSIYISECWIDGSFTTPIRAGGNNWVIENTIIEARKSDEAALGIITTPGGIVGLCIVGCGMQDAKGTGTWVVLGTNAVGISITGNLFHRGQYAVSGATADGINISGNIFHLYDTAAPLVVATPPLALGGCKNTSILGNAVATATGTNVPALFTSVPNAGTNIYDRMDGKGTRLTQVVMVGGTAVDPQSTAKITHRAGGNNIEFGHQTATGYGSTLGSLINNGNPFLAFSAEHGTANNSFMTRGKAGSVLLGDLAGGFKLQTVANTSADSQTATDIALFPGTAAAWLVTGTAPAAGGNAAAGVKLCTTGIGVFTGTGAPTLSAPKGSLYLRSDGTTTNDRMYVNTNGSTTWTAVTTAA